jgi:hypothetical protein
MKNILLIAATWLTLASCTKDTIAPETANIAAVSAPEKSVEGAVSAVIEWTADPAVDGLGWVLRLEDNQVKIPKNLPENLREDGRAVVVAFRETKERFPCRCAEPVYYVEITHIEPKS